MQVSVISNIGLRRSTNQDYADYFINNQEQVLFVLCDGVGGNQAGDVASQLTTQYIGEAFKSLKQTLAIKDALNWMDQTINDANSYIYNISKTEAKLEGMSTTLVLALWINNELLIGHVGDSRAYVYSEGSLQQMTEDHSLVNELIKSGEITPEEGEHHPIRNVVTQSIGGTSTVSFEVDRFKIKDNATLLLCSDGLTNMVPFNQLQSYFEDESISKQELGEILINAANDAGGVDNITVILVTEWKKPSVEEVIHND